MSNGRVCANSNCHHTEFEHVNDMCWGKPKEIMKNGPTPGCRCKGFVARRDTTRIPDFNVAIKEPVRFRFVTDNDGHDYLIPALLEEDFHKWVASVEDDTEYDGDEGFEKYAIGCSPSSYTFTDPRKDQ